MTTFHAARILTIVDGTESTEQDFGSLTHVPLDEHDLTVMLGHAKVIEPANEALSGERTQQQIKGGYQLGTVSVFVGNKCPPQSKKPKTHHWVVGKEEAFYLFSLGPHCAVIGQLTKDLKLVPDGQSGASQTYIEGCKLWMRMNVSERALASVKAELLTHPHLTFPDIETALKVSVSFLLLNFDSSAAAISFSLLLYFLSFLTFVLVAVIVFLPTLFLPLFSCPS